MTQSTPKSAPVAAESKPEKVTDEVRIPTGDFVLTFQHEDDAREEFLKGHPEVKPDTVKVTGRSHDIGQGVTYEFTADTK